ncbi:transcription intermediary factor 1-beta isoform X5 [Salmo trutta]|uniref:transcription intermediary factor 1-beta isoform X5 n=1 Tax=Salmo trutta TaxID=8032 RepID=UPI0011316360|nr:transcription intermediary factor 1-beta-like isoform X5 [Salmo trutta]
MVSPRADRGTTSPVTVRPLCPLDGCGLCCTELKPDRNPQLLPCLHSVCRECVPLSDFKTECPVCGRQYTSSEIIDNPFLPSFPTDSKPWCGGCDEPVVCGWCVECGEPLCSDCVAAHKRVKLIRNHNVLPQLPPGFSRTALCPIHKREQMKLFCVTCDQLTCRDCQLTFHKEHKYQFAQDALPEQRKCLQYLLETVRMQRGTVQQNLQDLDGRLSDLEDLQESVRTEVKDILKGIWSVLVKRAMQLSKEMQDHCWKESECVTERQVHLRKLGERQKYVLAFTEKALKSEDHTSLLSCKRWVDKKSNLRSKIHSELQGVLAKNPSAVSTMKELKLHCGQDIHQTVGCFGEIVTKEVPFARLNLRKTLVGPIQINPPKFSLEQQRNSRASSTLSPSSQETSSTSAGNVPLSRRQPTLMHSLSCPPSSPYPHEPERLSFYHFSPDSRGPSLQALSSSCSDSPLSLSSTSAVNATDPQRCAVNTENDDSSSLSGIALDTPVPYHGYQGGSSKSDLMVELVSRAFHVKRKAGDENVGPQIKRSCLQPLKVPADSSCEKVPPIGAEKQAGDVAVTVVMEREATPNITDQNATAPVYRQEATKASGSRQSNLVVGRSVKTVNQPETVQTDSAFIETVQTDSAFIETVQTDSDRAETLQNEVVQSNFNKTETVQTDPVLTEPVYAVQTDTVQMEPVHSETVLTGVVQTATLQRDLTLTDCTEIIQTDMSTTNEVSTNDTVNVVSVPSCTQEVELDLINDFCSPIEEEDDNMADFDVSAADSIEETGCQVSVGLNNRFPQVSLLWMPILDAYVGVPPTRFRLLAGIKGKQTVVQVIQTDAPQPESPCSSMSSPGSLRSTHQLRPFLVRRKHCTACRKSGNLTLCVVCGRGFHRECHIPPIYSLSTERWQCMLCRDLSDLALLQDYSETDGELCMSPPDQMRCERLLLALLCRKRSVFLYRPAKLSSRPSHYIDITMIQGRLLRKLVPPYCTPSEFVSDVWLLLHIQLKRVKSVDRLQACFEKELGKTFEGTLHPSLLVNPHQGEAERNAEQEGDKEKVTMRKNPRPLEVERAGKKISRRTQ